MNQKLVSSEKSRRLKISENQRQWWCWCWWQKKLLQQIQQVRIALNKRLTKRCEKRFHVHQHKDFVPNYSQSTRVKRKMSLEFHTRLDLDGRLYWKAFRRLYCERHWLNPRMWWELIAVFLPTSTYLHFIWFKFNRIWGQLETKSRTKKWLKLYLEYLFLRSSNQAIGKHLYGTWQRSCRALVEGTGAQVLMVDNGRCRQTVAHVPRLSLTALALDDPHVYETRLMIYFPHL